ncbi:MAG: response regulator transcription factor [Bacteroidetes bacterium]|nr:response regulator transcription factor [Bacteroidota bacterium]
MKTSLAIVDDKSQNRISLCEQLDYFSELEVIFTAQNGRDFLEQMKALPRNKLPEVVLMDIEMPLMDGIKAVQHAHALYPEVKFLMLTVFDDDDKIFEAIKAGANGYLLKDEKISVIIDFIKQLVEIGGAPMSPHIARKAMDMLMKASLPGVMQEADVNSSLYELSDREMEVLKLLVEGCDYRSTAEKLFLSTHTVRKHIANIYSKLHVSSKAQAIRIASTSGLV